MTRTRLYLSNSPDLLGMSGWIYHDSPGKLFLAKPLEFVEITPENEHYVQTPTLTIGRLEKDHFAQCLANELHRMGIRPSNCKATDEHVAALGSHLTDLRKIAFNFLKIKE